MNFKLEDTSDKSLIALRSKVKRDAARETAKVVTESVINTAISLAVVVVLWVLALWAFDVTPYIGKGPIEVFEWMWLSDKAAENQTLVWSGLGQTLADCQGLSERRRTAVREKSSTNLPSSTGPISV